MTALVLLVLVWLGVLVPQALRARAERRQEFLDSFHLHLRELGRPSSAPPPPPAPSRRRPSGDRRCTIVKGLLLSMAMTGVAAIFLPGRAPLAVHLAVDNGFLIYVGLLVRRRDCRAALRMADEPAETGLLVAPVGLGPAPPAWPVTAPTRTLAR